MTSDDLAEVLIAHLPAAAVTWIETARTRMAAAPGVIHELFPAVGRCCGRAALRTGQDTIRGWTVDDAVRSLLLGMLPLPTPQLLITVRQLYSNGDAAERRGVLRALTLLGQRPDFGAGGVPIVTDALRTNDPRLIGAALGDYAVTYLDDTEYRQAVLKCVFYGIPLTDVAGLSERADTDLVRSLRNYALERETAGRGVPADVRSFIGESQERTRARAIQAP
jgi:L-ribulose-5-phosphate 3-epimerase